jgi:hypothetical protein
MRARALHCAASRAHAQRCKALRSAVKIGLTGTLMQNNHMEMWAVMDQVPQQQLRAATHAHTH